MSFLIFSEAGDVADFDFTWIMICFWRCVDLSNLTTSFSDKVFNVSPGPSRFQVVRHDRCGALPAVRPLGSCRKEFFRPIDILSDDDFKLFGPVARMLDAGPFGRSGSAALQVRMAGGAQSDSL